MLLQTFPKIKQYEAVVRHGTEFPVGKENQPMSESSLFNHISIADTVTVQFELGQGENFTVVCPSKVCCFDTYKNIILLQMIFKIRQWYDVRKYIPVLPWTKLFWIDVLLQKKWNKQKDINYFVIVLTLLNSTSGKLFSYGSHKEDLHCSVF